MIQLFARGRLYVQGVQDSDGGRAVCLSGMLKNGKGCGTDHPICISRRTW
jgi:hypothetical protein